MNKKVLAGLACLSLLGGASPASARGVTVADILDRATPAYVSMARNVYDATAWSIYCSRVNNGPVYCIFEHANVEGEWTTVALRCVKRRVNPRVTKAYEDYSAKVHLHPRRGYGAQCRMVNDLD